MELERKDIIIEESVQAFIEVWHDDRNLHDDVSRDRAGFWKRTDRTDKEDDREIKGNDRKNKTLPECSPVSEKIQKKI